MELSSGQMLGGYRLVERVGRGGMAEVWKAYQASLARYVAIKVLPSFLATDASYVERFKREARVVSSLRHPNILAIIDYGQQDGTAYMVSEYLDGGTLAEQCGAPLPLDYVVRVLRPIASALDYAHARGVVHRDVKPSNILLERNGTPVLADFGVAAILEGGARLTAEGMAVGTPTYMAPEQVAGETVSAASDLYSLGIVIYELLTGRPPFVAETPAAVALAHLHRPLPPPRSINPAVSVAAESVILGALARSAKERFPSARALIDALDRAGHEAVTLGSAVGGQSAGVTEQVRSTGTAQNEAEPGGGRRRLLLGIAVIVALVGAAAFAAPFVLPQAQQALVVVVASATPVAASVPALPAVTTAPSGATEAVPAPATGTPTSAGQAPLPVTPLSPTPTAFVGRPAAPSPAPSPGSAFVHLANLKSHADAVWGVSLAPDGRRLVSGAFGSPGGVAWDTVSGQPTARHARHEGAVVSVVWWTLGSRNLVASGSFDGTIRIWNPASGEEIMPPLSGQSGRVWAVAVEPAGDRLASASADGSVAIWTPFRTRTPRLLQGGHGTVYSLAWSARLDGQDTVAAGTEDGTILGWDPADGSVRGTLTGQDSQIRALAWSPDGLQLASGGADGSIRLWEARPLGKYRELPRLRGPVWSLAWSPDSQQLASGSEDGAVRIWRARGPQTALLSTYAERRGPVFALDWGRDDKGDLLAIGRQDAIVELVRPPR